MISKIIKLFIVIIFACGFSLTQSPKHASAMSAVLYVSPATGNYEHSTSFSVTVLANTDGEAVNAVEVDINYSDNLLTFDGFDSSGSAFEIEAPGASGGSGNISITRASTSSRTGSNLKVVTLQFTSRTTNGTATLTHGVNSKIIRSSDSTDILSSTNGGSYTIFTETGGGSGGSGGSGSGSGGGTPPPPPPPSQQSSGSGSGGTSEQPQNDTGTTQDPVHNSETENPAEQEPSESEDTSNPEIIPSNGQDADQNLAAGDPVDDASSSQIVVISVAAATSLLVIGAIVARKFLSAKSLSGGGITTPVATAPPALQSQQPVAGTTDTQTKQKVDELLNDIGNAEQKTTAPPNTVIEPAPSLQQSPQEPTNPPSDTPPQQ